MKNIIVILLGLSMFGCSMFNLKRAPEVVPSCFSDGENQELFCKAQRTNEEGKISVTRCIGKLNKQSPADLRGKCAEKICSEGSNTDCLVKGEMRVLETYGELATSQYFNPDEEAPPVKGKAHKGKEKASIAANAAMAAASEKALMPGKEGKKGKGKNKREAVATAAVTPAATATTGAPATTPAETGKTTAAPATVAATAAKPSSTPAEEIDVDPSVRVPVKPDKTQEEMAAAIAPKPKPQPAMEEPQEAPQVAIALKPAPKAKKKGGRVTASAVAGAGADEGFKKVCVAKGDAAAPETLRGKCATRSCRNGKCSYKGRKEMFDYVSKSE